MITAGSLLSRSVDVALVLGTAIVVIGGYLIRRAESGIRSTDPVVTLVALLCFCLVAFFMFSVSRTGLGDGVFLSTRYMAVVAMFVLGFLLLSLVLLGESSFWRWSSAAVLALSLATSVPTIASFRELIRQQDIGAIAARLGVAEGIVLGFKPTTVQTLKALNHYPFDRAGDGIACGLLGSRLDPDTIFVSGPVRGFVDTVESSANRGAVSLTGWAYSETTIDCILVISADNQVVGAAVGGFDREDVRKALSAPRADVGWTGIARGKVVDNLRVVVRLEEDLGNYVLPVVSTGAD